MRSSALFASSIGPFCQRVAEDDAPQKNLLPKYIRRFCGETSYRLACWNADVKWIRISLEVGARKLQKRRTRLISKRQQRPNYILCGKTLVQPLDIPSWNFSWLVWWTSFAFLLPRVQWGYYSDQHDDLQTTTSTPKTPSKQQEECSYPLSWVWLYCAQIRHIHVMCNLYQMRKWFLLAIQTRCVRPRIFWSMVSILIEQLIRRPSYDVTASKERTRSL